MPQMSPSEQRQRLSSLISDITHQHGEKVAEATQARAANLSPEQAALFLGLVVAGANGADEYTASDLSNLGYDSVEQVLAMSRLIEAPAHQRTVTTIVSLGLFRDRAEALLRVTPPGLRLLSVSDDRSWRRAMRLLPEQVLAECVRSAESQTSLWMAVVSAQDGHMAQRIERFKAAGRPYVAWIVSGHSLEALEGITPSDSEGRGLTRLEIHRAVRFLDRGEGTGEADEQGRGG